VRTVGALPLPLPSASWATVRTGRAAKPLAGLDFGMDADDADGADGSAPGSSGVEKVWIVVMLMVRVRARPSRPKPMSMLTLRKKVAARRSRPESARGEVVQAFSRRTASLTCYPRASRRVAAVPVHTVCPLISPRTPEASGSAAITRLDRLGRIEAVGPTGERVCSLAAIFRRARLVSHITP